MDYLSDVVSLVLPHWPVWFVSIVLVLAAVIDGFELRVPNWVTFPMIVSGWVYSSMAMGWEGLGWSLVGTAVGLALLLPAYAIGGMGAGDVKLLAGVGAWMHGAHTFYAFCAGTVIGAVLAVIMASVRGGLGKHSRQFWSITCEILTVRDPNALSAIAADR